MPSANERASSRRVRLAVAPQQGLLDEPLTIEVRGLAPDEPATLRAISVDHAGRRWRSNAEFVADADGRVDPRTQSPRAGTYAGVQHAGLLWSMTLDDDASGGGLFSITDTSPIPLELTVESAGETHTVRSERLLLGPGVRRTAVRDDGLVATLFTPDDGAPRPGVILVGGSDGGLSEAPAALLAAHSYTVLAVAYFGVEHLPGELCDIPLEYFARAIAWLQADPAVRDGGLAVVGRSRGGELALLLGATFPSLRAVVAYVPSGIVFPGLPRTPSRQPRAAWTQDGQPVPYFSPRHVAPPAVPPSKQGKPLAGTPLMEPLLDDVAALGAAAIPVERIGGPVLLFSGTDDQLWPSSRLAETVMQRLARHGVARQRRHIAYPGAGHAFWLPNVPATVHTVVHPVAGVAVALGGSAPADAAAAADAWTAMLAFLHDQTAEAGQWTS
jgi:dienelactone hydrolase